MKIGNIHVNRYDRWACGVPCNLKDGFCFKFKDRPFYNNGFLHRLKECYEYEQKLTENKDEKDI